MNYQDFIMNNNNANFNSNNIINENKKLKDE